MIFECGFSLAKFGSERVLLLVVDSVENFSNIDGVKYIKIDSNYSTDKWKQDLNMWINKL